MTGRILISALLLIAAIGCEKQASAPAPSEATANAAPAAAVVAPAEATETATKTAGETASMDCGGEMKGGECGGGEGCNRWDEAADEVAKRDTPNGTVWKTVTVKGMHCGGCERRVVAKLGDLDGVVAVEADAELGQVRIGMAPKAGEKLATAAVKELDTLGYKVQ